MKKEWIKGKRKGEIVLKGGTKDQWIILDFLGTFSRKPTKVLDIEHIVEYPSERVVAVSIKTSKGYFLMFHPFNDLKLFIRKLR